MSMNIANEVSLVNISADKVDSVAANVVKKTKSLQKLTKLAGRKSIMTMAQPGMYVYPIVASSSINIDTLMAIARSYQLTYASNVATAYSLNPIAYLNDTKELSEFVEKFHTNSKSVMSNFNDINVSGIGKSIGVESDTTVDNRLDIAVEANVDKSFSQDDLYMINASLNENIEDSLAMESLNNMYRPYDRTYRIMMEKINTLKIANEDLVSKVENVIDDAYDNANSNGNYTTSVPLSSRSKITYARDKNGDVLLDKDGNPMIASASIDPSPRRDNTSKIERNNNLDNMEPTMVNVNIICHGDKTQFAQSLTIGVKTSIRLISSNLMIASMIEACKESKTIFKFLKWSKGEIKTWDFILGFSAAKKKALEKNAKQEVKFMKQAATRKKANGIGRFLKNEYLPTLSVVLTSYEVEMIKQACNIDLNDIKYAYKLISKYYLLSLAIYDPDQNTVKFLFDCDNEWGIISLGTMKSLVAKTNDVLNQNEVMKITGRR